VTPRKAVTGIVVVVVAAAVIAGIDAAAGGKHPVLLTAVAFIGAAVLIGLAVTIPGGLLARPEGTRAGELGVHGDMATSLDEAFDSPADTQADTKADTPADRPANGGRHD